MPKPKKSVPRERNKKPKLTAYIAFSNKTREFLKKEPTNYSPQETMMSWGSDGGNSAQKEKTVGREEQTS